MLCKDGMRHDIRGLSCLGRRRSRGRCLGSRADGSVRSDSDGGDNGAVGRAGDDAGSAASDGDGPGGIHSGSDHINRSGGGVVCGSKASHNGGDKSE